MSFASAQFVVFFITLFALYYLLPQRWQWKLLLAGSVVFYAFAGWYCLLYIGVTTVTTFFAARRIDDLRAESEAYLAANRETLSKDERKAYKAAAKARRSRLMKLCLVFNFGVLAVVKYTGFVLSNVSSLLTLFGGAAELSFSALALPMGISFYTFQAMGYLIDVAWDKCRAERSFGRFALFVTFFPQLIQGPISRWGDLSKTLYAPHPWDTREISMGLERVIWGFAKKLILADRLAIPLRALVAEPETYQGVYVLAVMFLYAAQLYADFTGGIDITIGVSQMLGVRVTENFVRPFFSKNTAEYWRRWHITMGTWFRDYVFYPLSTAKWMLRLNQRCRAKFGNGFGRRISVYVCTIILWFVTGVWHGASWNFIVWGLLNGVVIIISQECEPLYARFHARFPGLKETRGYGAFEIVRTFCLMGCIRVFDVYRDVPLTFRQIGTVFTRWNLSALWDGSFLDLGLTAGDWGVAACAVAALYVCSLLGVKTSVRERLQGHPNLAWAGCTALIVLTLVFGVYGIGFDSTQFIYNQF